VKRQRGFTLIEMMVVVAIIAILSGLVISISSRTYGANAQNVSDQINSTVSFARMRAVASRRFHRVEVTPSQIIVWQWSKFGMATPAGSCPANCWQVLQQTTLPNGISVWNTQSTVQVAPGATVTQNTSLDAFINFKPDGSSTGGTIFITDRQQSKKYRVLVYKATGSSYARAAW
jgi:prepilin-type N-terminal cleavage/methylation domain-containing protein